MAELKEAVAKGAAEIIAAYGPDLVRIIADGQGGAWVEITTIELGAPYQQMESFYICHLPFSLPNADIYPAHVRPDLNRVDGQGLGEGFGVSGICLPGETQTRQTTQVSRRTRGNFAAQTPLQKIEKVLSWMKSR